MPEFVKLPMSCSRVSVKNYTKFCSCSVQVIKYRTLFIFIEFHCSLHVKTLTARGLITNGIPAATDGVGKKKPAHTKILLFALKIVRLRWISVGNCFISMECKDCCRTDGSVHRVVNWASEKMGSISSSATKFLWGLG